MSRGGKREGAGRKAGGKTTKMSKTAALVEKATAMGITPLEYMMSILNDTKQEMKDRFAAAVAAAPYIHPKLTTTTINDKRDTSKWSLEQIIAAEKALDAAAAVLARKSSAVDADFRVVENPAGSEPGGVEAEA